MDISKTILKMQELGIGKVELANPGIEDPNCQAIVWQSGDGMSVTVMIQKLPRSIMGLFGTDGKYVFVTLQVRGHGIASAPISCDGCYPVSYVAHCFNLQSEFRDTFNVAALLNMILGDFDYGLAIFEGREK